LWGFRKGLQKGEYPARKFTIFSNTKIGLGKKKSSERK
jgi:hypothetical protein